MAGKLKKKAKPWSEEFIITAYELARLGNSDNAIAAQLGISFPRLRSWQRKRPAFAKALERGREARVSDGAATFKDYVFNRLSPELKRKWDELQACETEDDGLIRSYRILSHMGRQTKQHLFFYALIFYNFNASEACRFVGITKSSLDHWVNTDPDFRDLLNEVHWHKKNFAEGKLLRLVEEGDTGAVIFVNKTLNRDRGYSDKITVEMTGSHDSECSLEELNLTIEMRKALLEAIRAKTAETKTLPDLSKTEESEAEDAEFEVKPAKSEFKLAKSAGK